MAVYRYFFGYFPYELIFSAPGLPHSSCSRHKKNATRLDEPAHGNVLLSCGPQKLDPTQQLREFNADFVPRWPTCRKISE